MRFHSPALPGVAFLGAALGEVGLLAAQAPATLLGVPLWLQLVPVGVLFGIGSWGLVRLFKHEDATEERFRELEEKTEEKSQERHRENTDNIHALTQGVARMEHVLLGIQGHGGMLQDQQKNQDRRHQLAQDITLIYGQLHYMAAWMGRVGEALNVPFDPPAFPAQRRRRGEGAEDG